MIKWQITFSIWQLKPVNAVSIATVIKYFACSSLICMIMSMYTGHKMISGNKKTRKQAENTEAEE
ncbi:hypothetical protein DWV69_02795 [Clostridium sp. AF12-19]|nr:hypothetical protein DWV71_01765 [Clostridium sp. AF12-28]RHS29624.1 hypothetical protein DWV69_02795 [Clostridium sp. AF12-19]